MTTPRERLRALHCGKDLLQAIQQDGGVGPELQGRAQDLAARYPAGHALQALLDGAAQQLPDAMAQAIEQAGRLFMELQFRPGVGSQALKGRAMRVLRHFPQRGEALDAADPGIHGGLAAWLAKEAEDGRG